MLSLGSLGDESMSFTGFTRARGRVSNSYEASPRNSPVHSSASNDKWAGFCAVFLCTSGGNHLDVDPGGGHRSSWARDEGLARLERSRLSRDIGLAPGASDNFIHVSSRY